MRVLCHRGQSIPIIGDHSCHPDLSGSGAEEKFALSRRQFVHGLAAGGALFGLGLWPKPVWALKSHGQKTVLAGTEFDLSIGETPLNFTGATRTGITVNGSVPAPLLRWREGDTVNLRVSNKLPADSIHGHQTSIHWHGILLPANMDGVPGLSFDGINRGETYPYRFDVIQNGRVRWRRPLVLRPISPPCVKFSCVRLNTLHRSGRLSSNLRGASTWLSVMGAGLSGSSYLRASAARANTSASPLSSVIDCMASRDACARSKPCKTS